MKGIVYTKIGAPDVLKIMEIEKPVPKANQALIKVKASAICASELMRFTPKNNGRIPFSTRMMVSVLLRAVGKVPGAEVSGIVETVGENVKSVKVGDAVFAATAGGILGGWAEYALADEATVCLKPANLSFEEAAAIPVCGITALGAVRKAQIQPGQQALIYGASGGVGQFAVQLAKAEGAVVTAVCSTRNLETARKLGADFLIDYQREDFTAAGKTYDVIIGVNGYNPLGVYKRLLNRGGRYVAVGGAKQGMTGMIGGLYAIGSGKKLGASTYFFAVKQPCLPCLKELAESGKIKPFIEKVYPVREVADAVRYLIAHHAQGKVALTMNFDD